MNQMDDNGPVIIPPRRIIRDGKIITLDENGNPIAEEDIPSG